MKLSDWGNKKLSFALLALMLMVFLIINLSKSPENRAHFIDGDGSGHYAWLSALFIHHSIDFKEVFDSEKNRKSIDYQGHNYHEINGITINKFPPGTAFLLLPFFLLAMLISSVSGLAVDAYNPVFQYAVGIAGIFWCWIGLLYLFKLIRSYKINFNTALLFTLSALFATNLFAYTYLMPSFSHVYSFAVVSMMFYYVRMYFLNQKSLNIIVAAIALGVVFMVRPANILAVAAIPFFADNWKNFKSSIVLKAKSLNFVIAILVFIITISPYLVINYLQTSHLFFFAYKNEGFYWTHPEVLNFLFSFRKGWFVYTPFFLLLFPASFDLFRKNKYQFFWFLTFFIILIYVFSSWWNWFYGDSFGMRPMVDFTSIFIIVITLLFKYINNSFKKLIYIFIFIVFTLNLIQTYQYAKGIIHPDSMNKEAYFKVFLKTSEKYSGIISGGPEYYYGTLSDNPFHSKHYGFEVLGKSNPESDKYKKGNAHTGEYSINFNSNNIYGGSYELIIPDSLFGKKSIYLRFSSFYKEENINSAKNALYVMDIKNKEGKTIFYKAGHIKQIPDDIIQQWRKSESGVKIPLITNEYYSIKFYIWNKEKTNFLVDDFRLDFYRYN